MSKEHPLDQREMAASWGYRVVWFGGIGNFIGEWMGLFRDADRWGFFWVGHTSSTDRDEYELLLPSCPCRSDPACPHDWSRISALSRSQRDSIAWDDGPGTLARLRQVRDTWDGPSSQAMAFAALDAMIALVLVTEG